MLLNFRKTDFAIFNLAKKQLNRELKKSQMVKKLYPTDSIKDFMKIKTSNNAPVKLNHANATWKGDESFQNFYSLQNFSLFLLTYLIP